MASANRAGGGDYGRCYWLVINSKICIAIMKIYIYIIYFPESGRLFPYYIGYTNNPHRRMLQGHLRFDSLVGRALNKYDEWQVSILHTVKTYEEAKRIEIEEIRNYNCVAPNGYNLTAGGDGGFNPSPETRKKLSKAAKRENLSEETLKKKSDAIRGKHHSEETIEKIRESQIGRHPSEETIKKMSETKSGENNPIYGTHPS